MFIIFNNGCQLRQTFPWLPVKANVPMDYLMLQKEFFCVFHILIGRYVNATAMISQCGFSIFIYKLPLLPLYIHTYTYTQTHTHTHTQTQTHTNTHTNTHKHTHKHTNTHTNTHTHTHTHTEISGVAVNFDAADSHGVDIKVQTTTQDFSAMGYIVDQLDSLIDEWFPGEEAGREWLWEGG